MITYSSIIGLIMHMVGRDMCHSRGPRIVALSCGVNMLMYRGKACEFRPGSGWGVCSQQQASNALGECCSYSVCQLY